MGCRFKIMLWAGFVKPTIKIMELVNQVNQVNQTNDYKSAVKNQNYEIAAGIRTNQISVINNVLQTDDYSMFKILEGNRNVNKLHVRRLKESFKDAYLLSPIVVNQHFQIIDGQHRFEAAKEMKLPINFIVCNNYSLKEVQLLNTNMKNWKKEDYLNAYCDLKYPEYLKFRDFMGRFPELGIASCETILTNSLSGGHKSTSSAELKGTLNESGSYAIRYFQEGDLSIPDYEKSIENAEKIMMIKHYYDGFNRPTFVRAMIGIFKIEYYSHSKLLERLAANPTSLQHCANVTQYKLLIEDIYNFRSRDKVSLRF